MSQTLVLTPPSGRRRAPGLDTFQILLRLFKPRLPILERLETDLSLFGDIVRYTFRGRNAFVAIHPDAVRHVLETHHLNYRRAPVYKHILGPIVGNGLVTSEGEVWRRQRRLLQPSFHPDLIRAMAPAMAQEINDCKARWPRRGECVQMDVSREMMDLSLRIAARTMFSTAVDGDIDTVSQAIWTLNEHFDHMRQSRFVLPRWVPTARQRRFRAALHDLDRIARELIAARGRDPAPHNDLLTLLVNTRDEQGNGMSTEQVRDEVITLLLAGHETTARLLTWSWYLLSRNPEAEEKLHAETTARLGGRGATVDDLEHLPYTRQVLEESLRLYPPAWVIPRQAVAADVLHDCEIPSESSIFLLPYFTHRHPDFWEKPLRFDPDRFTPARSATRPRHAYFPFGGGPHHCIGYRFAQQESQLILATFAQHYRVKPITEDPVVPLGLITLGPGKELVMRVTGR